MSSWILSGVILPQVRTAAEVAGIVADCRFPNGAHPGGRRGRGFLGGHFDYGRVDPDQYMREADEQIFVCVMVETAEVRVGPSSAFSSCVPT